MLFPAGQTRTGVRRARVSEWHSVTEIVRTTPHRAKRPQADSIEVFEIFEISADRFCPSMCNTIMKTPSLRPTSISSTLVPQRICPAERTTKRFRALNWASILLRA